MCKKPFHHKVILYIVEFNILTGYNSLFVKNNLPNIFGNNLTDLTLL
jgi:hypothetical protein